MKRENAEHKEKNTPRTSKKYAWKMEDLFGVLKDLDKQKVTDYVIKQVSKNKVPMLTFWKQAEIYKVALPHEWWQKYFLVAKKKKDTHDEKYDLRKEFRLQQEVYSSVAHPHVKVPEVFGYQELPNGEQFIVMEFVPGQTIYTLLLNKVVEKNHPERAPAKDDREADINMLKLFGLESTKNMISKIETTPYIYSKVKWMKIFTQEQAKNMKKYLKEFLWDMHKKWIYHRDLWGNLRNIMICPDGKIYIIDFWKAIKKHDVKNENEAYTETTEQEINQYYSDEEILNIIDAYTE